MKLKPFLLDMWLDRYKQTTEFDLAASTGPVWTLNEVLNLAGPAERERFFNHKIIYSPAAGSDGLREAIAEMQDVTPESVQIVTGASEALVILMWLAAEPGANVILPKPGFTTFSALPESLGIETRFYHVKKQNDFAIDIEEIIALADEKTKLILVNNPHNPTGATLSDGDLDSLHAFASGRGIQFVCDEVYHPIYHGQQTRSASRLPGATVIHDFSKAFPLSGVRTGWMVEQDKERRERYWNARAYFSVSSNSSGEILAEIAMRNRNAILGRSQKTATENLKHLDRFMAAHSETIGWIRPRGGMTAFPWMLSGEDARPFCQAVAESGILLAPGDCFDTPDHFRIGFAACDDRFLLALDRLAKLVESWPMHVST